MAEAHQAVASTLTTESQAVTVVLDYQDDNDMSSLHQCLLMLFDSPLNLSGNLRVYIRLGKREVIKMHREVRVPRTFKRFQQLFTNFIGGCDMPLVTTEDGQVRLIERAGQSIEKVLKGSKMKTLRISNLAPDLISPASLMNLVDLHSNITLFLDIGPVDFNILGDGRDSEYEIKTIVSKHCDYETFSLSRYPISPALTCVKLTSLIEEALGIF